MSSTKPCPFCGGEVHSTSIFKIVCNNEFCNCELVGVQGFDELARCWNTRPVEDKLKAENKRLKRFATIMAGQKSHKELFDEGEVGPLTCCEEYYDEILSSIVRDANKALQAEGGDNEY